VQITHRETIAQINELTGAAMTTKGFFYEKNQPVPEGERKLYLVIEGPTEVSVKRAKVCLASGILLLHLHHDACMNAVLL